MLLSVFTPTHNPVWLAELYKSLQAQTYKNWEWVVLANGDTSEDVARSVQQLVKGDRRVRLSRYAKVTKSIGELKRTACKNCTGDVFVEADHDDVLTEDCLAAVADAVEKHPDSFVYSDTVTGGLGGGTCVAFTPNSGWQHYQFKYNGIRYTVNKTHKPTPRSLCEILYAPDHVRAWTRSAYEKSGGHDPNMSLGDDHDLIVRTYLRGVEFVYIPRPLYFHRVSQASTSIAHVDRIQEISKGTQDRFFHPLIMEWCRRNKLECVDLGGEHNCPPGFVPIDTNLKNAHEGYAGDVFDVLKSLKPDSLGCVRASDFLEHIPTTRIIELFNLVYSRLVPGGYFITSTPAVCDNEGRTGRGAYQDPTHVSFWSSNNFWYFTDRDYSKYLNGEMTARFQTVRVANYYPSEFHKTHLIPYVLWDGLALKDDDTEYFPGPKRI